MQKTNYGRLTYFQFNSFSYPNISHAIFSRLGGVSHPPLDSLNLSSSVNDSAEAYLENRARAYGVFGRTNDTLVHAHLVHKADVATVTQANHGQLMSAVDALITNDVGCGLTMNYADCAPVLVYDPKNHAIGLGHAGWGGTVCDVPGAMVRAMTAAYGSQPANLIGAIGPCISADIYEVGDNVITAVQKAFGTDADQLLIPQPQSATRRPHFDLPKANRINFERAGVTQVELSGICTGQNIDLFFSHRKENGKTGRFGVIFTLDKPT